MFTQEQKNHAKDILNLLQSGRVTHDQESWVAHSLDGVSLGTLPITEENLCETTLCIAGASVFLNEGIAGLSESRRVLFEEDSTIFEEKGRENLGLTRSQADVLFYHANEAEALSAMLAISEGDENALKRIISRYI